MSKLHCRIELNKENSNGISITIKSDEVTQLIKLNDKEIRIESQGSSSTSSLIQTPESISISCKKFKLDADEIQLKSKQSSQFEAGADFSMKSTGDTNIKATKNVNIEASMNLSAKASIKADLEGNILNVKGNMATVEGQMTNIKGSLIKMG